jgi:DNA-binding GntR family transcriptional regulator
MTARRTSDLSHGETRRLHRSAGFVEEALRIIRADIMSLRIPPDTRISIDSYSRELGVSQTPVREALSMLEAMGLVTKRHYVGYCSAPQLSRKQLDELFEVRLLLEPYAARRAAERINPDLLGTLRRRAEDMRNDPEAEGYDNFAQLDSELHDLIAGGSGNAIIQEALSRLHAHFHIFRLRANSEVAQEAWIEHERIIEALAARDPDGAEAAMRAHIDKSYQRLIAVAGD